MALTKFIRTSWCSNNFNFTLKKILIVLLLIPCGCFSQGIIVDDSSPLLPIIYIGIAPADTGLVSKTIENNTVNKLFGLHLVKQGIPMDIAVAGKYFLDGTTLFWYPMNALGEGLQFDAISTISGDTLSRKIETPQLEASDFPISEAEAFFPYSLHDSLPCNQLYFHVRFSQPMFPDRLAYRVASIWDETKNEFIPKLWRERSYWIDSNRVLVLMIHPGRVKRGIGLDLPFVAGNFYEFFVSGELTDHMGRPVKIDPYQQDFKAATADYTIPKIRFKQFIIPEVGDINTLVMIFSEEMDYASIVDGVTIHDEKGQRVDGWFSAGDPEITFDPYVPWTPGKYTITFDKIVADLAGNRLNRLFEMSASEDVLKDEPVVWEFKIK